MSLVNQLILHEGICYKPYQDTEGHWTVGVGRNLETTSFTDEEVKLMLASDIRRAIEAAETLPWFNQLSTIRQRVIIDMIFNLGLEGFKSFYRTIGYIEHKRYDKAAVEMLNSLWADQVGVRAIRLSSMMKTDENYS